MVTQFSEVQDYARYDLKQIHALAAACAVVYVNPDVQRDTEKFGYDFDEVCSCLVQLAAEDFKHSGRYANRDLWYDVYTVKYQAPSGHIDDLYIKLTLGKGCLVVNVFSFHPFGA
jgi:hypothetical protein